MPAYAGEIEREWRALYPLARLDFMFHPPDAVIAALVEAGFAIEARLDREPYRGAEHPSRRTYLLAARP